MPYGALTPKLEIFLRHGQVDIDNNPIENAIRPTAVGEKNWLFVGSEDTAERSAILYTLTLSRKHRGARQDRQALGTMDPVSLLIIALNRKILGWGNYFRHGTATDAFSRIDNLLHRKLWQWALRRFKRNSRQWIIDHLFSGVEVDRVGKPLLRKDGTPRQRAWAFKSPFVPNDQKHVTLHKLTDIHHKDHSLVRPEQSYYDGDWPYWQKRMKARYPGTPPVICVAAFQRQKGICLHCKGAILPGERLSQSSVGKLQVIRHTQCPTSPPKAAEEIRLH